MSKYLTGFQQSDLVVLQERQKAWYHLGKFNNLLHTARELFGKFRIQLGLVLMTTTKSTGQKNLYYNSRSVGVSTIERGKNTYKTVETLDFHLGCRCSQLLCLVLDAMHFVQVEVACECAQVGIVDLFGNQAQVIIVLLGALYGGR
jgi:hypothetical protein